MPVFYHKHVGGWFLCARTRGVGVAMNAVTGAVMMFCNTQLKINDG